MKKSIFNIFMTIVAFSFLNWNAEKPSCKQFKNSESTNIKQTKSDFVYDIDSRFMTTITKENLLQAKSIIDILPKEATSTLSAYQDLKVSILGDSEEISAFGNSHLLNPAQIKLLHSTDYSTDFCITSQCKQRNPYIGTLEDYDLVYYITIIPEKEAEYQNSPDDLIQYLKENSKKVITNIDYNQLKPGQIRFVISKKGSVEEVTLTSSCGFNTIDETMLKLIANMPQKWNPATNSLGEKVEQELLFFYGMQGC